MTNSSEAQVTAEQRQKLIDDLDLALIVESEEERLALIVKGEEERLALIIEGEEKRLALTVKNIEEALVRSQVSVLPVFKSLDNFVNSLRAFMEEVEAVRERLALNDQLE